MGFTPKLLTQQEYLAHATSSITSLRIFRKQRADGGGPLDALESRSRSRRSGRARKRSIRHAQQEELRPYRSPEASDYDGY